MSETPQAPDFPQTDRPLIDETRIDIDAIASRDHDAELYATNAWLDSIAAEIDMGAYTGQSTFDPQKYDDEGEWLVDELCALFIRMHNQTDLGILELSGALRSFEDHIMTVSELGVEHYIKKEDIDPDSLGLGDPGWESG